MVGREKVATDRQAESEQGQRDTQMTTNPAGLVALGVGAATYIALLDPVTFEPNRAAFAYLTASIPAIVTGGLTYLIGSLLMGHRRAGPRAAATHGHHPPN